jgi:regulatory protein
MLGSRAPKKLNAEGLWAYSLKLVGGRAQSIGEVRQKLQRRAENEADVEITLGKLREYGYLNDTRFAESYATWRKDNEGFGRMRVLRDLRQRRISSKLADTAVQQVFEGTDEESQVEAFLQRKYRNVNLGELLQDDKKLQSAYRRLRYAGFSSGVVVKVLKRYASQADRLEDEPEGSEEEPAD